MDKTPEHFWDAIRPLTKLIILNISLFLAFSSFLVGVSRTLSLSFFLPHTHSLPVRVRVRGVNIPGEQRALSLGGGLNHCSEGPVILPVSWDTLCIPPSYSVAHTYTRTHISFILYINMNIQTLLLQHISRYVCASKH